jgi:hypothetical protein
MLEGKEAEQEMIWGYLLHLSFNMWADTAVPGSEGNFPIAQPYLRCETALWNELLERMTTAGLNLLVIDLGDGIKYDNHPEIAVRRAWSTKRLRKELDRIRRLGIEPIPKLNFSTCHDAWLGPYGRMVSSDIYYEVCRDLISEVIDLFDQPRFFHLGMDEETAQHHQHHEYAVIRQHDLWWRDLYFYIEEVEKKNVRPWVWSDYVWHHPDLFYAKMPRSVLQSNWYYYESFSTSPRRNQRAVRVKAYGELDARGYDLIPTGSNYVYPENFQDTVDFCRKKVTTEHLLGFMQSVWQPTLKGSRQTHIEAIEQVGKAIEKWQ